MLVTFSTKYHADIIMFGDIGEAMLKMMGQSGTVPSAILADDVAAALANLKAALSKVGDEAMPEGEEEDESPVSISKRAIPLIDLLTVAVKEGSDVMWK